MSEEFNEFLARQMKLHAKRVGMKKGGAHPYSWHSAKAAAFEAWENRQKVIEQQQQAIDGITNQLNRHARMMTELYTALLNFDVSNMREDTLVNYDLYCQGVYDPLKHGRIALKDKNHD
jgi:hypothetical protein